MLTLAHIVQDNFNKMPEIIVAHEGKKEAYTGSGKRIASEIKGLVFTEPDEGITLLKEYYLSNRHWIESNALLYRIVWNFKTIIMRRGLNGTVFNARIP